MNKFWPIWEFFFDDLTFRLLLLVLKDQMGGAAGA